MDDRLYALLVWFGVVSALTFLLFGWDKLMARLGKGRVPEIALLLASFLGGAAGGTAGMLLFRHKIRKAGFFLTLPLFLIFQAGSVFFLIFW